MRRVRDDMIRARGALVPQLAELVPALAEVVRALAEVVPALVIAASYPLYIQLDALPRADAIGPPVNDRYPWLLAALAVGWFGARAPTLRRCAVLGAVLSLGAVVAYTDDAAVTGVAVHPARLAFVACAALVSGHLLVAAGAGCARRRFGAPDQGG